MPISEDRILEALADITVPGGIADLMQAGVIRHMEVEGATVRLLLAIPDSQSQASQALRTEVERAVAAVDGVDRVEVQVQALMPMAEESTPAGPAWADRVKEVSRIIAIASGKGGVGKSTVAANLALALAAQGQRVGLLDADIYGPSQQMMMGTSDTPTGNSSGKIEPVEAPGGVRVMSLGFIIDADQPVIWRGPMLMKALEQLFGDVEWGALDYMVVDLPPGTGDVALTLCQNVPLAGAIIVTTPQDVALVDARKGLHMFRKLQVPVLGIVENMSHFQCPECGHVEHVFGSGGGRRTASDLGVPFLGAVPLEPAIVAGGDRGTPVVLSNPDSASAKAFVELAAEVAKQLS